MLGILFVILLENFNTRISNKGQLEKAISVPVIGCIPAQKNNGRGSRYRVLTFENNPNSVQAEAYRQLRNNISYSFDKEAFSIISIISPDSNTGKSTVASNIALAFSEVSKNVIIVDCNLRNPTLHKIFNISNMQGLSDVFVGREKVENVIREYCNNISVLPWGKVLINSSEILESNKIDEVLEHLKSNYDLVIIDTAAIQNFTDTHLLSSKVDGNIFVVKEDKTRIEEVIDSKKILDKVGAKVIGTVLN
nr:MULTISPECIES: CpsD/CapB family tyrosine-protein kinase [Clostridium]